MSGKQIASAESPAFPKTVLIVEDDAVIRALLVELLQLDGYEVMTAGNGQEAIDLLRAASSLPNLILLDLMMPVKDGFQFRNEQLEDVTLNSIPVVIMSAMGMLEEKRVETKAKAYIKKPLDIDEALGIIAENCS